MLGLGLGLELGLGINHPARAAEVDGELGVEGRDHVLGRGQDGTCGPVLALREHLRDPPAPGMAWGICTRREMQESTCWDVGEREGSHFVTLLPSRMSTRLGSCREQRCHTRHASWQGYEHHMTLVDMNTIITCNPGGPLVACPAWMCWA